MSESVGLKELLLKELLMRKIEETNANPPCYGKFTFGTEYGERECNTCPHIDPCTEQTATNIHAKERAHLSSDDLHAPGVKDDKAKPMAGVLLDFSRALEAVVDVGTYGAKKYARGNWQFVPNGFERYTDAMLRHLLAEQQADGYDEESECLHTAHVAWNALARLEIMLRRNATL